MVKLDVTLLRYMSKDDFRVLTSVEMGMKNHELVPASLIAAISSMRGGGISKILHELTRQQMVSYERGKRFDGYRLTYRGYDYLSLNVLTNRQVIASFGSQIGVGKESDVYVASDDDGVEYAIKLHRLGRVCFRKVNEKRDYKKNGRKTNWIYLSRLAALREFAFLKALHEKGFPVPRPVDCNRHVIVMELINGTLLNHMSKESFENDLHLIAVLYDKLMNLIVTLANDLGLVHGDFNEFNIMIANETFEPTLIDFPQMIPVSHELGRSYFERDVNCILDFFAKKFAYECDNVPEFDDIEMSSSTDLMQNIRESDWIEKEERELFSNDFEKPLEDLLVSSDEEKEEHSFGTLDESEGLEINEKAINNVQNDSYTPEGSDEPINSCDNHSVFGPTSTVASSIAPEVIKTKLKSERMKKEKLNISRKAMKNIKGESNAIRRQRKSDRAMIKDDLKTHRSDPF